eukprot:m.52606 g.52606  ORF g.52606 m.52606 type:complete len:553 (-) comp7626_c0_seq2:1215-2873(-)
MFSERKMIVEEFFNELKEFATCVERDCKYLRNQVESIHPQKTYESVTEAIGRMGGSLEDTQSTIATINSSLSPPTRSFINSLRSIAEKNMEFILQVENELKQYGFEENEQLPTVGEFMQQYASKETETQDVDDIDLQPSQDEEFESMSESSPFSSYANSPNSTLVVTQRGSNESDAFFDGCVKDGTFIAHEGTFVSSEDDGFDIENSGTMNTTLTSSDKYCGVPCTPVHKLSHLTQIDSPKTPTLDDFGLSSATLAMIDGNTALNRKLATLTTATTPMTKTPSRSKLAFRTTMDTTATPLRSTILPSTSDVENTPQRKDHAFVENDSTDIRSTYSFKSSILTTPVHSTNPPMVASAYELTPLVDDEIDFASLGISSVSVMKYSSQSALNDMDDSEGIDEAMPHRHFHDEEPEITADDVDQFCQQVEEEEGAFSHIDVGEQSYHGEGTTEEGEEDHGAMMLDLSEEEYSSLPSHIQREISYGDALEVTTALRSSIEVAGLSEVLLPESQLRDDLGLADKTKAFVLAFLKTNRFKVDSIEDGERIYSVVKLSIH